MTARDARMQHRLSEPPRPSLWHSETKETARRRASSEPRRRRRGSAWTRSSQSRTSSQYRRAQRPGLASPGPAAAEQPGRGFGCHSLRPAAGGRCCSNSLTCMPLLVQAGPPGPESRSRSVATWQAGIVAGLSGTRPLARLARTAGPWMSRSLARRRRGQRDWR